MDGQMGLLCRDTRVQVWYALAFCFIDVSIPLDSIVILPLCISICSWFQWVDQSPLLLITVVVKSALCKYVLATRLCLSLSSVCITAHSLTY